MSEELMIARRVQRNLSKIGVSSKISDGGGGLVVSGRQSDGAPFAIRISNLPDLRGLDSFARAANRMRRHPGGGQIVLRLCDD